MRHVGLRQRDAHHLRHGLLEVSAGTGQTGGNVIEAVVAASWRWVWWAW
jgi:hypothetical protein